MTSELKRWWLMVVLVGAACSGPATVATGPAAYADLVLLDGAIYTVDDSHSWVEAVAVTDGRIAWIGTNEAALAHIGPRTDVIALDGKMVLPGFHDAHNHLVSPSDRRLRCQLRGLEWPTAVLEKLRECHRQLPSGQWLRGTDLDTRVFDDKGPHRSELDAVFEDIPVFLADTSGSLVFLNSPALAACGIDAQTPEPEFGVIEREQDSRTPTGVLRGDVVRIPWKAAPRATTADIAQELHTLAKDATSVGITSIVDLAAPPPLLEAYFEAQRVSPLDIRVRVYHRWDPSQSLRQLESFNKLRAIGEQRGIRADAIKILLDGGFTDRSAATFEAYTGSNDNGELRYSQKALEVIVSAAFAHDYDVAIHAVGDRGVSAALDAFTAAGRAAERRNQISHAFLATTKDISRFRSLNLIANLQPAMITARSFREIAPLLGQKRAAKLWPLREFVESGVRVALGSDYPTAPMAPLAAIETAVTRRPADDSSLAINPTSHLTLSEAIAGYTIDAAWISRQEMVTGSIEVGKDADLVVLAENLFEIPISRISEVEVRMTFIRGRVVYQAPSQVHQ